MCGRVLDEPLEQRAPHSAAAGLRVDVDGVLDDAEARGRGVGRALLERLIEDAPAHGIWTIQTSIMAANGASLALHTSAGFRTVGRRERIAERDGRWQDAMLLELRLA